MHTKPKKVQKNQFSTYELVVLCVLVLVLVCIGGAYYISVEKHNSPNNVRNVISSEEYKKLLLRAHELTDKYKSLTGSDTVPSNLLLSPADTLVSGNNANTQKAILINDNLTPKIDTTITGNGRENVVLGMAQGTDSKNLAVFCKSLRKVSDADVLIFVNSPVPARHKTIANENKITLIEFDPDDLELSMAKFHPSTLRWVLFHNYFMDNKKLQEQYKRVWMIDVRDSYFQQDPFAFVIEDEKVSGNLHTFHAFQGVESTTISACGWNGGWIRDCFGDSMLKTMGHNHIICSGVSVANNMKTAMKYITLMNNIITNQENTGLSYTGKFPQCERNGVDQGVHNVLMHTNALTLSTSSSTNNDPVTTVKIWNQKDSPVANMQAHVATVRNNNQEVFNAVGKKVAVVHQYDRYPELQKYLFSTFVDWLDASDFSALWSEETTCAKFSYKENVDMFFGKCDLKMQGGATSAASCCQYCSNTQGCQAFTFTSSVCYLKSCKQEHGGGGKTMQGAVSGYLK